MESKKAFDEMNKTDSMSGKTISWLLSILLALAIGTFGFLWQMNGTMAILKDHDQQHQSSLDKVQMDLNQVKDDISIQKINDATVNQKLDNLQSQINELKNKH